jgi:predicted DNA-binding protein
MRGRTALLAGWVSALVLVGSWAKASTLSIPPAPNPLTAMGISVRDLMDRAGLGRFDPVVVLVRTPSANASCPSGMVKLGPQEAARNFDQLNGGNQGGATSASTQFLSENTTCYSSNIRDNEFIQWLSALAIAVLGQFTGDQLASFIGGNKREVRLGELLNGLCVAWGNDPDLVKAVSETTGGVNYLGETLCNVSEIYRSFLEVLRASYVYGDRALDNFYQGVVRRLLSSLLNPIINSAKITITNAYNSLPIAKPIYQATKEAKRVADVIVGQIEDFLFTNALSRSSPYIDSTVAWLLSAGQEAWEEAMRLTSPQAGTFGLRSDSASGGSGGLATLPPDKLSLLMASSSPRVLGQLQAIGLQQATLTAEKENYLLTVEQEARKRVASARENLATPRGDPQAAQELVKQAKQQTNERELLITLIEVSYFMAQESMRNQERLEEMVANLVQESAKTNAILSREATKELDAQIKALEDLKQQVLQAVLDYSSEVASAANVMDNAIYLIGSLGVDRAGLVLTEEQFERLRRGEPLSAP